MMLVSLPSSLLMLVGIPLWPHQLISWYIPVSLAESFFIPFDFNSHMSSFLSQYPYNSPLTPLQNFPILITTNEAHINFKWSLPNLIDCPTCLLHLMSWSWSPKPRMNHVSAPLHCYTDKLGQILAILVYSWVEMMPWCNGWGWHPPVIASHIKIRYVWHVLAPFSEVHRHISAPLYCTLLHRRGMVGF